MSCRKCPHHVRHGKAGSDGKSIEFKSLCGLRMKVNETQDCSHFPFKSGFEYTICAIYLDTFKTPGQRNDVNPTSGFEYSDKLTGNSITEMELL